MQFLTITSNYMDGNFRHLGDCFCSTSAEPLYCVNNPTQDEESPG